MRINIDVNNYLNNPTFTHWGLISYLKAIFLTDGGGRFVFSCRCVLNPFFGQQVFLLILRSFLFVFRLLPWILPLLFLHFIGQALACHLLFNFSMLNISWYMRHLNHYNPSNASRQTTPGELQSTHLCDKPELFFAKSLLTLTFVAKYDVRFLSY